MKKIFLLNAMIAMSIAAMAQNDTVSVVRPDSVSIVRNNENVSVRVYGNAENRDYRYSMDFAVNTTEPVITKEKNVSKEFDLKIPLFGAEYNKEYNFVECSISPGILWGFNGVTGAPNDVEISALSSLDIWLPGLLTFRYVPTKNFSIDLCYGLEWRNYRMIDSKRFDLNDNKVVSVVDYPADSKPDFSRIKVFSQTLSLTGHYRFCKEGYLRVGPVFSFNEGLSVKTKYKDASGKKIKEKQDNPKANLFSLEWLADVQFRDFGFWVKYTPKNVLRADYGPQFSTTTVGVSIFW